MTTIFCTNSLGENTGHIDFDLYSHAVDLVYGQPDEYDWFHYIAMVGDKLCCLLALEIPFKDAYWDGAPCVTHSQWEAKQLARHIVTYLQRRKAAQPELPAIECDLIDYEPARITVHVAIPMQDITNPEALGHIICATLGILTNGVPDLLALRSDDRTHDYASVRPTNKLATLIMDHSPTDSIFGYSTAGLQLVASSLEQAMNIAAAIGCSAECDDLGTIRHETWNGDYRLRITFADATCTVI